MATGRIDDRTRLSSAANAALDERLGPEESVLVILPGSEGSAIIGTERRAFVWHDRLTEWPYEGLTGIDASIGVPSWAALRGPAVPLRNPGWTTRDDFAVRLSESLEAEYAVPILRALITAANPPAPEAASGLADERGKAGAEGLVRLLRGSRDLLDEKANSALDVALDADETVESVIRGQSGTGLVATDRRVLIWKQKQLHSWPYEQLSSVEVKFGFNQWIALRGPTIEPRKPAWDSTFSITPANEAEARHRLPIVEALIAEHATAKVAEPIERPTRESETESSMSAPVSVRALPAADAGHLIGRGFHVRRPAAGEAITEQGPSVEVPPRQSEVAPSSGRALGQPVEGTTALPGTLADRRRLSKEANAALEGALQSDEPVHVVIRGSGKSALIGTDRRAFVWKDGRLRSWPYNALSEVEANYGFWFPWVALRGPALSALEPTSGTIAAAENAIQIYSLAEAKQDLPALQELVVAQTTAAGYDVRVARQHEVGEQNRLRAFDKLTSISCFQCRTPFNAGQGVAAARVTLRRTQRDEETAELCWRSYWNLLSENLLTHTGVYPDGLAQKIDRDPTSTSAALNLLIDVGLASRDPETGFYAGLLCPNCQMALPLSTTGPNSAQSAVDGVGGDPATFVVVSPRTLPTFADVGGMQAVKDDVRRSIGLLFQNPRAAAQLQVGFNGILMHGPPGTGKTHLAKAIAGEFGCRFIHLEISQLISAYRGQSAKRIASAFDLAKGMAPSILFFDEFDAIAQRRDSGAGSSEDTQVLTQLLRNLESIRDRHDVVVLAATNDVNALDPAVSRPGRFDRKLRIDLPDRDSRREILAVQLRTRPAGDDIDLDDLAGRTSGHSAAALTSLINEAALHVLADITQGHGNRVIRQEDLLRALTASGAQDRPLVGDWSWDELILAESSKRELMELQRLIEEPERATRLGIQPPRGALLYGPPGTGKTTIAKVLAAQAKTSFYPIRGSEIISKWLGEAEQNVAQLWERARANAPSIIFLDEIDAVAPRRAGGMGSGADQAMNRVVNQLLQEIDGVSSGSGVFVLGATNRPDMLDEALLRGGRLARQIFVPLPDEAGRHALLELFTRPMSLAPGVDLHALAAASVGYSGADLQALCQQAGIHALMSANESEALSVGVSDFSHALMVAGPKTPAVPDLGLCDWHGPDAPDGCDLPATEELGRRQYCRQHADVLEQAREER